MKKNLFILTVSLIGVMGTCGALRAEIASESYVGAFVDLALRQKVDADWGIDHKNEALVVGSEGFVTTSKIGESNLANDIKEKISNALVKITSDNLDNSIEDKAITVAKLNGGANANKVLTVADATGTVSAEFVKIPVGQTGTGGAASVWVEN